MSNRFKVIILKHHFENLILITLCFRLYIAVEVFTARDKLSGALSLAIDKLGGEDGAHGFFGSPVKRLQRYNTIIQSTKQHLNTPIKIKLISLNL